MKVDGKSDGPAADAPEPDYRASLAAERTYLAHVRTGLALLAAGIAVAGALPDAGGQTLRRILGAGMSLVGAVVLVSARPRWRAVDQAMRNGAPLPQAAVLNYLGATVAVIGLAAAAVVIFA